MFVGNECITEMYWVELSIKVYYAKIFSLLFFYILEMYANLNIQVNIDWSSLLIATTTCGDREFENDTELI